MDMNFCFYGGTGAYIPIITGFIKAKTTMWIECGFYFYGY